MYNFESNPQYRFANEHGANATEVTAFGNYPPTGGHKMQNPQMTEAELYNYAMEERWKMQEAQEYFEKNGIENYNDR